MNLQSYFSNFGFTPNKTSNTTFTRASFFLRISSYHLQKYKMLLTIDQNLYNRESYFFISIHYLGYQSPCSASSQSAHE